MIPLSITVRRLRPCAALLFTSARVASPRSARPPRRQSTPRAADVPALRHSAAVMEPEATVSLAELHERQVKREKAPWRMQFPHDVEDQLDVETSIAEMTEEQILSRATKPHCNSEATEMVIFLAHQASDAREEEGEEAVASRLRSLRHDPRCLHLVARAVLGSPHLSWYKCFHLTFAMHKLGFVASDRPLDAMYHLLHHHMPHANIMFVARLFSHLEEQRRRAVSETEAMRVLRRQCEVVVGRNVESCVGVVSRRTLERISLHFGHVLTPDQMESVEREMEAYDRDAEKLRSRWRRTADGE